MARIRHTNCYPALELLRAPSRCKSCFPGCIASHSHSLDRMINGMSRLPLLHQLAPNARSSEPRRRNASRHRKVHCFRLAVFTLLLCFSFAVRLCEAVDVGDAEAAADLNDDDTGGSGASGGCSNVTTLAVYAATTKTKNFNLSGQIIAADSCEREYVNGKQTDDKEGNLVYELDLQGEGIERVIGIPSAVQILDLSDNEIASIDNATFPATLAMLNLTRNPIESLDSANFPPKLKHLNIAGGDLMTLENFSFPSSVISLNFSGNPITRIAGVIFPASLARLVINAGFVSTATTTTASTISVAAAAKPAKTSLLFEEQTHSLEEFEVRQTDFDRFEILELFDVSATSTLKCSDVLAKPRFVNSTMLCVLSDNDFIAKYAHVAAEAAIIDGTILVPKNETSVAAEPPLLHETLHQSRSWFLIVSATLLGGFVLVFGICGCVHISCRRAYDLGQDIRRERLDKSMRKTNAAVRLEKTDKETESLLSDPHEVFAATEVEKGGNRTITTQSLAEQLEQHLISHAMVALVSSLTSPSESESGGNGQQNSHHPLFTYALATFQNQSVVLKTLSVRGSDEKALAGNNASLRSFLQEIHLNTMVSNPHVVRFIGYFHGALPLPALTEEHDEESDGDESVTLLTEYMGKGSLDAFIQQEREQAKDEMKLQLAGFGQEDRMTNATMHPDPWTWQRDSPSYKSKLSIAVDIARALAYLHSFSPSLFHGNLSSRKVLLDESWRVKLNDLSCCSALWRWSERQQEQGTQTPTSADPTDSSDEVRMDMTIWTAPEVIDGQQYTTKADMYSFGILLSQLDTYEFPVDALHRVDSEVAILGSTRGEGIPVVGGRSPVPIRILTMNCISFQPEDRPSAQEALEELLSVQMDLKAESSCSEDAGW